MKMQSQMQKPGLICQATALYARLAGCLEGLGNKGLDAFAARLWFVAILLFYYFNSAGTKVSLDAFPTAGAFAQILPPIADQYLYDTSAIPFFPWHLIVIAGTLAEFVLPILITLGLFTRLASLAMIGFIAVQTLVDGLFHGAALGTLFNGAPDEIIDQRALWIFLLVILAIRGGGKVSIDYLLSRRKMM